MIYEKEIVIPGQDKKFETTFELKVFRVDWNQAISIGLMQREGNVNWVQGIFEKVQKVKITIETF